ncbi:hypothetical protein [Curvivirga aplysinae]|uniref:hypothetical protein n=1 Tax=Curvivirga aplysinae TaxID=2529852 RepID=UPI0012BC0CF3|nr:hypothetical protein [Curvivirga aplysinae]MTI10516.1 hypothetical protein [Curvivirga aplysinae]
MDMRYETSSRGFMAFDADRGADIVGYGSTPEEAHADYDDNLSDSISVRQVSFKTTHNGDIFKLFYDEGLNLECISRYLYGYQAFMPVSGGEFRGYRHALDTADNRKVAQRLLNETMRGAA